MHTIKTVALALALGITASLAGTHPPAMAQTSNQATDLTFWSSIKNSKNPEEYRAYLKAFPNGVFAPLAKLRLKQLSAAKPSAPGPAAKPPSQVGGPPAAPPAPPTAPAAPPSQPPKTAGPGPSSPQPAPPTAAAPPAAGGPPAPESGPPPVTLPPPTPQPRTFGRPNQPQPPSGGQPPASQPPRNQTVVDFTNRDFVLALQEQLYKLNYDIEKFTGRFDRDTYRALIAWQRRIRATPNGEMTAAQWQRMQRARISTIWGAISYNANSTHAYAFSKANRREAEEASRNACRQRSGRKAKCSTMAATNSQCIAMAGYNERWGRTRYFGVRVHRSSTLQRAERAALRSCERLRRSRGNCNIRRVFCADGSHDRQ